ncbi:collagen-like SclB domain protein [Streptococcus pyogenes AA472]|nr:collagen-like SclB domain protein [Streptococcus pyogenes AA472]
MDLVPLFHRFDRLVHQEHALVSPVAILIANYPQLVLVPVDMLIAVS